MADNERVLVVHASERGSTKDIAEFIGARLRVHGAEVDVRHVKDVLDLAPYGAVVLGSAVHNRALLPGAEFFVLRNVDALHDRPVWLFSVGIGPSLRGPVGRLLRDKVPPKIAELLAVARPRDYRAFAGVVPRTGTPLLSRVLLWLCGGRPGDLRDWPAIDAWAASVAEQLHLAGTSH